MAGLVPLAPTRNNPLPLFHNLSFSRCSVPPYTKAKIIPLCSPPHSSSSSSSLVQDPSPPSDQTQDEALSGEEAKTIPPSRGCKACGREELEKGCNGEGRIQGGIATVPGFGWWPIKAFRPCPGFVASGGRYKRRGQSMDEVAGGRGDMIGAMASAPEAQSSKEKQSPRRFKG